MSAGDDARAKIQRLLVTGDILFVGNVGEEGDVAVNTTRLRFELFVDLGAW